MAALRGKWAEGIVPRNFAWIIKDRLAVCERPGGYGSNHRRVRRMEEIIWIRQQGFDYVTSIIAAPHNLHNYDELEVAWRHRPLAGADLRPYLEVFFPEIQASLDSGQKLIVHAEEVGDRIAGLMAGYIRWAGMVPYGPQAISIVERILSRPMGPIGREIVGLADDLAARRDGVPSATET